MLTTLGLTSRLEAVGFKIIHNGCFVLRVIEQKENLKSSFIWNWDWKFFIFLRRLKVYRRMDDATHVIMNISCFILEQEAYWLQSEHSPSGALKISFQWKLPKPTHLIFPSEYHGNFRHLVKQTPSRFCNNIFTARSTNGKKNKKINEMKPMR